MIKYIDPTHEQIEGINHLIGAGKTVTLTRREFAWMLSALDSYPRDLKWHVTVKGTSFDVEIAARPDGPNQA